VSGIVGTLRLQLHPKIGNYKRKSEKVKKWKAAAKCHQFGTGKFWNEANSYVIQNNEEKLTRETRSHKLNLLFQEINGRTFRFPNCDIQMKDVMSHYYCII
jgi:hypothetical protein